MTLVPQLTKSINNDTKDNINEKDIDNNKEDNGKYIHGPIVRIGDADCLESVSNAPTTSEAIVNGGNEGLQQTVGIVALTSCTLHIVLMQIDESKYTEQVNYYQEQKERFSQRREVESETSYDVL